MAVLFYAGLFGGIAFVIKLLKRGVSNWEYWLAILLPVWIAVALFFRWYRNSEVTKVRAQVESEFPLVVLGFNRVDLASAAQPIKGIKMNLDT